ncbi:MAG: hotdog fold thioesterase [Flavobacteriales bacterium]|nr:hotdog fold thioesterase [Flavobacteriales bacterium]MCB9197203.1 hotdog fold thioesterase [Flavobacteriales bacterium]
MSPNEIVDQMMAQDKMSQWLGIEILEIELDRAKIKMTVRDEMVNGFQIAHGGITYSLADSCLAFAANTQGQIAVSIETSISHLQKVKINDILVAEAVCIHRNNKVGTYEATVLNQNSDKVAHFKGTVFITQKPH